MHVPWYHQTLLHVEAATRSGTSGETSEVLEDGASRWSNTSTWICEGHVTALSNEVFAGTRSLGSSCHLLEDLAKYCEMLDTFRQMYDLFIVRDMLRRPANGRSSCSSATYWMQTFSISARSLTCILHRLHHCLEEDGVHTYGCSWGQWHPYPCTVLMKTARVLFCSLMLSTTVTGESWPAIGHTNRVYYCDVKLVS